jgi:glycosyltransferase involved in cell wall biosynthesis
MAARGQPERLYSKKTGFNQSAVHVPAAPVVEKPPEGPYAAMTPLVSVIMPVRNGQRWLREAIDSVLAQPFGDVELIVVDDGSDDATPHILDECARQDARSRVIHQAPQGVVVALNAAIAAARAPYLARLDADDRAKPDRLARQFAFMQAHPDVGLLGSWAEKLDRDGAVIGHIRPPTEAAAIARFLRRGNPFVHSSVMMRTALVRALGGYRAAFRAAEDYDLWLRLAEIGGLAMLPEYLIQYRWHDGNLTRHNAIRQAFSVRLAQRASAARRRGADDPAADLATPPDWWEPTDEASFFIDDVGFYRFLDAAPEIAPDYLPAVRRRLFGLNHTERKLAQLRLLALLRQTAPSVGLRLRMRMLIALLHPTRALGFVRGHKSS